MSGQDEGLALAESKDQGEQRVTNPQGDFMWYELLTEDAVAAGDFYGPILGWTTSEAGVEGAHGYRLIHAADGDIGGMMNIPAEAKTHGMRPTWLGYVTVDNVDAAAAKIVADGGKQHMEPMDVPGIIRFAMLADPQGATFYIGRGMQEGTSTAFASDKVGHCQWNELLTSDQAAAWKFYGDQFGWKKGDVMPMGDMGDYEFLTQNGQMIGAFMRKDPDKPSRWRFYFGVGDIDVAVDTVKKGGGTIAHGPAEVPGGIFVIIGTDPQGAEFGLVGPRKG